MNLSSSLVLGGLLLFTLQSGPVPVPKAVQSIPAPTSGDTRTPITSLPTTITECGSYVLARCLTGEVGSHGIEILADDVTLDLNGFTLQGVPGSLSGIRIGDHSGFEIQGGTLRDWGEDGIDAELADQAMFHDLRLRGNGRAGLRAGARSSVRNCISRGNGDFGIYAADTQVRVRDCTSSGDGHSAVTDAGGIVATSDSMVLHNSVDN